MGEHRDRRLPVGLSFSGALALAFIVLKLCGVISWSWLWVTAPIWLNWVLVIVLALIYLLKDRRP